MIELVSSIEQSSTIINSHSLKVCSNTDPIVEFINADTLNVGIMIETNGGRFKLEVDFLIFNRTTPVSVFEV